MTDNTLQEMTLKTSVEKLPIGTRAKHSLIDAEIETIGDLITKRRRDLFLIPNVGNRTAKEIEEALLVYGFSLFKPEQIEPLMPAHVFTKVRELARQIISEVARKRGVDVDVILSERRTAPIARARQEAYYRIYNEIPQITMSTVARLFRRDRSAVLHGIRAHAKRLGVTNGTP